MPPNHPADWEKRRVDGNSEIRNPKSEIEWAGGMRIVLIRLSAFGDIVHAWPLACALREALPRLHLSWVVEEHFRPLVDGHPAVDSVVFTRTRQCRRRPWSIHTRAEIAALKSRFNDLHPDVALDPQGVLKSAFVTRWTGAPRRIGLALPWRRERLPGLAYTETVRGAAGGSHVVDTNLEMVRAIDLLPPSRRPPDGAWLLDRVGHRFPTDGWQEPCAVVLPGTGGAHKDVAVPTRAEVSREIAAGLNLDVVVAWGPREESRAAAVVEAGGNRIRLAPPTDLEELAANLGGSSLVVGGDTRPVHLAASFGVPTVAVFLASDWRRNGPLGPRTTVVSGAGESPGGPSGSARAAPLRPIASQEIISAALNLID
jgi:lipopolysaccharide heptosyltransferase I